MEQTNFFTYKGRPLVRKGAQIYYGEMSKKAVALLTIQTQKKLEDISLADEIQIQLISTNPQTPPQEMVIKHATRKGMFEALDLAEIWLERI